MVRPGVVAGIREFSTIQPRGATRGNLPPMNPPPPDHPPVAPAPPEAAAAPPEPSPARAAAPPASGRRIPYQPALDGLRAFAILTIMVYHGQATWPRGGYLSVDLFFVLSGYLITTLLVAEWNQRGEVDLGAFWSGRARRLLPALFLMLAGIARVRWDALATLAYVANWRFAFTHLSYFEQFGDSSPLTHMWTLGIEEQYYLLWPLLLIVGLRLARGNLRVLLAWTLVATLASATLMALLYRPHTDPSRLYYGTDTRAQALLLGGALAFLLALRGPLALSRPVLEGVGMLALGGYLAMLVLIPDTAHWMYLGGFALAAIGCAVTIAVATQQGGTVQRLFATPPLPQVGRISYGLVELPVRRGVLRRRRLARPATVGAFAAVAALLVVTTGPGRVTAGDGITLAGMTLGGDPDIGCGVARAPIVLGGSAQPVDPKCTTWPTRWRDKAAQFRADVGLLVVGGWEVLDRQVDGRVLRAGTPEYERYLDGELQLAYDTLAPSSRRVAFLNVPCFHQPETGLDRALAETRNDPARGAWMNGVLARFVAAHADKAVLLDIKRFLCPNGGYVDRLQGVKVRYDGVHFSKDGAKLAWQWLGPQLRRLA